MITTTLTLSTPDGLVLDQWEVHWSDACDDVDCPADLHLQDLEAITSRLAGARQEYPPEA